MSSRPIYRTQANDVQRLDRIARVDGLQVRQAEDRAQRAAWLGDLGVFDGTRLLFAANRVDAIRGWLYTRASIPSYRGTALG